MATVTPNFNWPVPTSTDLVKDGATAIEALGDSIDASLVDLKGGTTGQVLSKNSNTDMDFTWVTDAAGDITGVTAGTGISGGGTSGTVTVTNSMATAIDAKGDLVPGTGADTFARLAVGANGTILTADSAEATGLKWAAPAGGGGYTSIASGTITSAALNITSIPGTYKALVLELRDITKASAFDVNMQFNSDSGANYDNVINRNVNGTLSTIGAIGSTAVTINASGFKASTQYNQIIIKIDGYENTDMWKVLTTYGSGTDYLSSGREVWHGAGSWKSTSAITSIQTDSTMSLAYTLWGLN
jgi:hypothetical protein